MTQQPPLFPLPEGALRPQARVIVLTGPSGSGKTSLTNRLGFPSLSLDNFYRNDDEEGMPRLAGGLIDWDDPASWAQDEAMEALSTLCLTGRARVPIYNIPTNQRTGMEQFDLGGQQVVIVEGIFASLLVEPLRQEGLLLGAVCIARSPMRNAWFRLARDLGEARKPVPVLLWRGFKLALSEPKQVQRWIGHGCEPAKSLGAADRRIREIVASAHIPPPPV
ncbi:ATP-binding protein [Actinomyces sp. F1_1611]